MYTIIERIKLILTNPEEYFRGIKKEVDILEPLKFLSIVTAISVILGLIVMFFFGDQINSLNATIMSSIGLDLMVPPPQNQSFWIFAMFSVVGYFMALIFSFVTAAILFVWLRIFGVIEDYSKVYQLYVYGNLPTILFNWIPILNFFLWIWSLFVLVIGTNVMFGVSKGKAFVIYIIPVIIFMAFFILLIFFLKALLTQFPAV